MGVMEVLTSDKRKKIFVQKGEDIIRHDHVLCSVQFCQTSKKILRHFEFKRPVP